MIRSLLLLFLTATLLRAQAGNPDVERALESAKRWEGKAFRLGIEPRWIEGGKALWYRAQRDSKRHEYVWVETESGARQTGATPAALGLPPEVPLKTSALTIDLKSSRRTGVESGLKFVNQLDHEVELFWIDREGKRVSYGKVAAGAEESQHTFEGHRWLVADREGDLATVEAAVTERTIFIDGRGRKAAPPAKKRAAGLSPDGRWSAFLEQGVMMLRDATTGRVATIRTGLEEKTPYTGEPQWAPDSSAFVMHAAAPTPKRRVGVIESMPAGQVQPKLQQFDYVKPGDPLPKPFPVLFRVGVSGGQWTAIAPDLFPNPFTERDSFEITWAPDSSEFTFDYNERGHQLYRVLAVDAKTAAVRVVVEERSRTFIDYTQKTWRHWLRDSGELLWMSERDGWCHLWLYDARTGAVKNQVTRGAWPVREVLHVDAARREVWFLASGLRAGEDPYHQHLCRVRFDGREFRQLTEGDGNHRVTFSPDRRFFTDTWSRVDQPPVHELRRSEDGARVCELERADTSALLATGWTMPERFVAKGRDGRTDIHGILIKPPQFDPARAYPVVEEIYAGPHSAHVPKEFALLPRQHQVAELGFVVVQIDGMGTNHRGKAFHDVCWKNLKDAGFPDRIAWMKEAARTRPWMDLSRVGIYGGSAGGQNAMRAVLDHGDFYKVAVADCGCHDNRMDKIWWNEQWMGWPVDEAYAHSSNVTDAHKLRGALLLIVGELDHNVDPASTLQVVGALQKAGKRFDFVPIVGAGHGAAESPYGKRRRLEFLLEHLGGDGPSAASAEMRTKEQIAGWTVHVHPRVPQEDRAAYESARRVLVQQLEEIARLMPPPVLAQLREVPIYISPEYPGVPPRAEYHPNGGWLRANGREVEMARAVEITNVRIYEREFRRMPLFMLHELAHAYHHRVLGFDHPEIVATFQAARTAGLYEKVERRNVVGEPGVPARAYAMTDHKEYFAELTEAYFGVNDFYPFNRAELQKHDPRMAALLERLWGLKR